jgi:hypothetical protein
MFERGEGDQHPPIGKGGHPPLQAFLGPGADARMHARISRSFFWASLGAALMYSVMLLGRAFGGVMILFYRRSSDTPIAFASCLPAAAIECANRTGRPFCRLPHRRPQEIKVP